MDLSKLKTYAPQARKDFIRAVTERASFFGLSKTKTEPMVERADVVVIAGREHPKKVAQQRRKLEARIRADGFDQTMEAMAYTWFNRFAAIRFMELHGYLDHGLRVLSHRDGKDVPEILEKAELVSLPGLNSGAVLDLKLDGGKDRELYRMLLVAQCNALNTAMPFLFARIDDETELVLPDNLLSTDSLIRKMVARIDEKDWEEIEIIGWLYQFYISEKKDEVFAGLKKNQKITAENIPAATQLFTPHWIVRYLVENSLGRLWLLNRPGSKLADKMAYYIAPEESETDFIRISSPEEIKICDPACGSGHMLTYAFDLLYEIYKEEGYPAAEIPKAILSHNLFGIEIDDRAGALAAFALFMKAASYDPRILRKPMQPNVCVLQNVAFTSGELDDYMNEVGRDLFSADLRTTLNQFTEAKNFGSLIVPKMKDIGEVARVIASKNFEGNLFLREVHARVREVLGMSDALNQKFHIVIANPPYMGGKGMNDALRSFLSKQYLAAKSDLMTAFMDRSVFLCLKLGSLAFATLDSWMFLETYSEFRHSLLEGNGITSMAYVGWNCFPDGHVYNRGAAFIIEKGRANEQGTYYDLADVPAIVDKDELFLSRKAAGEKKYTRASSEFLSLPTNPIAFSASEAVFHAFAHLNPLRGRLKKKLGDFSRL